MGVAFPTYENTLIVKDLVARYGERTVLSGVNLTVKRGEVRVILGGSGCGKSTLLKHCIGLATPTSGTVELLGTDLAHADEPVRETVLARIGMLFQGGALLNSLTVHENVALPLREKTDLPSEVIDEMVRMKLQLVSLAKVGHLTPPELSGGMKKRAALARAMALDPEILFCDEPSAGLDPITAAALDRLILDLKERFGMSLVVVTHELASIETIADKVLMIDKGQVIADGPLKEVKRLPNPMVRSFFDRVGEVENEPGRRSVLEELSAKEPT
jgi:phospholipid/cholesterol/gamma-HCH transport system ATP-binding protein